MQTVLLVDDSGGKLEQMADLAAGQDRRVLRSSGRDDAIRIITDENLDLVVTDLALHSQGLDTDGLEVLQAARKKDPNVPVIVVSNYLTARDSDSVLEAGAFDIIDRASSRLSFDGLLKLKIRQALTLREATLERTR